MRKENKKMLSLLLLFLTLCVVQPWYYRLETLELVLRLNLIPG